MGKTLNEIAQQLKDSTKKVQLIYAFNGSGKTRLSREFKQLVAPKNEDGEEAEHCAKILYYNAFTEDLFYWDNDLAGDLDPKLKIQPNTFTEWVLKDQGQDQNVISNFQHYTSDKLTPHFNEPYTIKDKDDKEIMVPAFSEVTFSFERGNDERSENIKISKGEESNFIWSFFYTLIERVVDVLNVPEPEERETDLFNGLEYIFIDDPVSSLDDNHLIELAVRLALLIKASDFSNGQGVKFIITTHSPLFYNALHNELGLGDRRKKDGCYLLERFDDGTMNLNVKYGDSNKSFSYHLHLVRILQEAVAEKKVEKYHFTLLRNLYEKTASFLGYPRWSELLPEDRQVYFNRIIQFTSHSTLAGETVSEPTEPEKQTVKLLLDHLLTKERQFWQQEVPND